MFVATTKQHPDDITSLRFAPASLSAALEGQDESTPVMIQGSFTWNVQNDDGTFQNTAATASAAASAATPPEAGTETVTPNPTANTAAAAAAAGPSSTTTPTLQLKDLDIAIERGSLTAIVDTVSYATQCSMQATRLTRAPLPPLASHRLALASRRYWLPCWER